MKFCIKCNTSKPKENFYKQNDRKSGTSYCKDCFKTYCNERWVERKRKAILYKGGSCQSCGYNRYYGALEFHHRNPEEKLYDWSKLRLLAWPKVEKELDKCDILCANCHRERHGLI